MKPIDIHTWTIKEVKFIQENYKKMTDQQMAGHLKLRKAQVLAKRTRMELWK